MRVLQTSQSRLLFAARSVSAAIASACALVVIGVLQRSQARSSKARPQIVRVVAVSSIGMHSVGQFS